MANQYGENQSALNIPEELSETELKTQMLIGVCGAHGVGKTVFLTAVFQTVHLYTSSATNLVLFDRENRGGANYFENIERQIRSKGETTGTLDIKLAQLHFKLTQRYNGYNSDILPVNFFDFAGDDFALIADLKKVKESANVPEAQKERIDQINEYLERCDGIIVLIDSEKFKPGNAQTTLTKEYIELPFIASVRHAIDSCVAKRRPLALVFTKMDKNPSLTLNEIKEFLPVKKMVLDRFTPDYAKGESRAKPYGDVHLITCYENDPTTGRAKILDESQNIWTKSAATIFMSIMNAAFPRFKERYVEEMKLQEQNSKEIAAKNQKEKEDSFKKKMRWPITIIVLLVLLGSAFVYWNDFKRKQEIAHNDQLLDTIGSNLLVRRITKEEQEELKHITTKNLPLTPGKLDELWQQIVSKLEAEFIMSIDTRQKLAQYEQIVQMFPSQTYNEKREKLLSIINQRMNIIDKWINEVIPNIELENDLTKRLRSIYELLTDRQFMDDPLVFVAVKRAFAVLTVESIMNLEQNKTTRALFKGIFSGIDDYGNGPIPYKSMYERIESIGDGFSFYEALYNTVNSGLIDMQKSAESRKYLIDPIFQELFKDISPDQRQYISTGIINALRVASIFALGKEHRLAGLTLSVEALETELTNSQNSQQDIFTKYFCGPVYQKELETVFSLLGKRYCQYWAIKDIKSFRSSMRYGTSELMPTYFNSINTRMTDLKTKNWLYIKESTDIFSDQRGIFSDIQTIINKWNDARNSRSGQSIQDSAKTSLENLLRDICNETKRPGEGDCADAI